MYLKKKALNYIYTFNIYQDNYNHLEINYAYLAQSEKLQLLQHGLVFTAYSISEIKGVRTEQSHNQLHNANHTTGDAICLAQSCVLLGVQQLNVQLNAKFMSYTARRHHLCSLSTFCKKSLHRPRDIVRWVTWLCSCTVWFSSSNKAF